MGTAGQSRGWGKEAGRGLHDVCGSSAPLLTAWGGSGEHRSCLSKGCPGGGSQGPRAWGILCTGGWGVAAYSAVGVTETARELLGLSHQRWDFGRGSADPCLLLGSTPSLARSRGSHPGLVLLSFSGTWLCVACGEQNLPALRSPDTWAKSKPVLLGGGSGGWVPAAESFRAERSYP